MSRLSQLENLATLRGDCIVLRNGSLTVASVSGIIPGNIIYLGGERNISGCQAY